ncbi:hypothetical protein [Ktedonobacter racemifer]|uniref:hypothetical protein n=1 Tax=Ktedonobacter racemifer TaxID=363277 RepID=UPI001469F637|nr:hypothetical protein [Ktedonobacter racemifer]
MLRLPYPISVFLSITLRNVGSKTPFLIVLLMLALFVVACGSTNSGTTAASTPKPPTPTPTPDVATYKGNGYTFDHPKGWIEQNSNGNVQVASLPDGSFNVTALPMSTSLQASDQFYEIYLSTYLKTLKSATKNYKETTVPATVQVGGETWHQKGFTGEMQNDGATEKINVLTVKHKDKEFTILYGDDQKVYDEQAFQVMLKSFKFTA